MDKLNCKSRFFLEINLLSFLFNGKYADNSHNDSVVIVTDEHYFKAKLQTAHCCAYKVGLSQYNYKLN